MSRTLVSYYTYLKMANNVRLVNDELVIVFGSYAGEGFHRLNEIAEFLRDHDICAYTVEEYFDAHPKLPRQGSLVDSRYCVDICDAAIFVFFHPETIGVDDPEILVSLDHGPIIELTHLDESDREIPVQFIFDGINRRKIVSSLLANILSGWVVKTFADQSIVKEKNADAVISKMKTSARGFCWSVFLRT